MKSMTELPFHYGIKFRIYPSNKQKEIIRKNSNASRFIYNELIALNKKVNLLKQVKAPIALIQDEIEKLENRTNLKEMANLHVWLNNKNIDSLAKANASQNYRKAWNMFRKVHDSGVPNFHKKGYEEKYQTNAQYQKDNINLFSGSVKFLDKKHISLPKLGRIRTSKSVRKLLERKDLTRIGTVTISKDSTDSYFISLQLASETPFVNKIRKTHKNIGIDLNLDNFLTDSNGNIVNNPRYYRKLQKQLIKAQRTLSRRQVRAKKEHRNLRESKNYQKQRLIVSSVQKKVMNQRKDFLNKLSTKLIKNHDLIVAEELRSKNLLKNHKLSLSISDVGWKKFISMLEYKAKLYSKKFIAVDPKNTSQTCSNCGYLLKGDNKLTLKDREWTCPNCGMFHIRDINAAQNILNKGLATL